MTDPKTTQQLNEAVAKALGLVYETKGTRVVIWPGAEDPHEDTIFDPATKTADALWALDKYCKDNSYAWALLRGLNGKVGCTIAGDSHTSLRMKAETGLHDEVPEAICEEIVRAAG